MLNVKEYLGQAYRLDQRINSKLEQIRSLNDLAAKCTSILTGMPHKPSRGISAIEDAVVKIVDLQAEIENDIDSIIEIKQNIFKSIKAVDKTEYQTLLELRYLCFKTWEQIAVEMGYTVRNVHLLHKEALQHTNI